MAAINVVATSNGYTAAASLTCQPTQRLTVQVANAGVYYQLRLTYGGTLPSDNDWQEDRYLLPGLWTFGPEDFKGAVCTGIRFKSGAAGTPATVSASD